MYPDFKGNLSRPPSQSSFNGQFGTTCLDVPRKEYEASALARAKAIFEKMDAAAQQAAMVLLLYRRGLKNYRTLWSLHRNNIARISYGSTLPQK